MKAKLATLGAMLLSGVTPAAAHRVDEYLQATIIAVEKDRVRADLYLTPGVGVLPVVLADIDADGNGVLSEGERRAYAERVFGDLAVTLNGERLLPRLVSMEFPTVDELREPRQLSRLHERGHQGP